MQPFIYTQQQQDEVLACSICRTPLDLWSPTEGEPPIPVHARNWEEYDHDPLPVPLGALNGPLVEICDFCSEPASWHYWGQNIRTGENEYGERWAGCHDCDKLIRRNAVKPLQERAMTMALRRFEDHGAHPEGLAFKDMVEVIKDVFARYVPTIHRRMPIPPPPRPPAKLIASRLPKYRDRLIKYLESAEARSIITNTADEDPYLLPGFCIDSDEPGVLITTKEPEAVARFAKHMVKGLRAAELYWVSKQFTLLAQRAGKRLKDFYITPENMPSENGLIIYESPIHEIPGTGQHVVPITGASWILVPQGVWITLYFQTETGFPNLPAERVRSAFGVLMPAAPGGMAVFREEPEVYNEEQKERVRRIRGVLLATWHLMRQPGIAEIDDVEIEKDIKRQYARNKRTQPNVRLINLRKRAKKPTGAPATGTGKKWGVRVVVGESTDGFWRNQAHGPNRSLRSQIWIDPYLAGPEDAPLKGGPETVKVLK